MADKDVARVTLVYKVINTANRKLYFGVTSGKGTVERVLEKRWREHVRVAISGKIDGHLQRAIRKRGPEVFSIELVVECVDQREACAIERGMIAQHGTMDPARGYNMSTGGELSSGVARRAETKAKLSAIAKQQWADPESRARSLAAMADRVMPKSHIEHMRRLGASCRGKKVSDETLQRMKTAQLGHIVSAETRAKISASNKGRKPPALAAIRAREVNTGRKVRQETKDAISASHKRLWADPATRPTHINGMSGRRHTEESKRKMSAAKKGKPQSNEHRLKVGLAQTGKKKPRQSLAMKLRWTDPEYRARHAESMRLSRENKKEKA